MIVGALSLLLALAIIFGVAWVIFYILGRLDRLDLDR